MSPHESNAPLVVVGLPNSSFTLSYSICLLLIHGLFFNHKYFGLKKVCRSLLHYYPRFTHERSIRMDHFLHVPGFLYQFHLMGATLCENNCWSTIQNRLVNILVLGYYVDSSLCFLTMGLWYIDDSYLFRKEMLHFWRCVYHCELF